MSSIERAVTKWRLDESDESWRFWVTRPVTERLEAVEQLRREHRLMIDVGGLRVPFVSVGDS